MTAPMASLFSLSSEPIHHDHSQSASINVEETDSQLYASVLLPGPHLVSSSQALCELETRSQGMVLDGGTPVLTLQGIIGSVVDYISAGAVGIGRGEGRAVDSTTTNPQDPPHSVDLHHPHPHDQNSQDGDEDTTTDDQLAGDDYSDCGSETNTFCSALESVSSDGPHDSEPEEAAGNGKDDMAKHRMPIETRTSPELASHSASGLPLIPDPPAAASFGQEDSAVAGITLSKPTLSYIQTNCLATPPFTPTPSSARETVDGNEYQYHDLFQPRHGLNNESVSSNFFPTSLYQFPLPPTNTLDLLSNNRFESCSRTTITSSSPSSSSRWCAPTRYRRERFPAQRHPPPSGGTVDDVLPQALPSNFNPSPALQETSVPAPAIRSPSTTSEAQQFFTATQGAYLESNTSKTSSSSPDLVTSPSTNHWPQTNTVSSDSIRPIQRNNSSSSSSNLGPRPPLLKLKPVPTLPQETPPLSSPFESHRQLSSSPLLVTTHSPTSAFATAFSLSPLQSSFNSPTSFPPPRPSSLGPSSVFPRRSSGSNRPPVRSMHTFHHYDSVELDSNLECLDSDQHVERIVIDDHTETRFFPFPTTPSRPTSSHSHYQPFSAQQSNAHVPRSTRTSIDSGSQTDITKKLNVDALVRKARKSFSRSISSASNYTPNSLCCSTSTNDSSSSQPPRPNDQPELRNSVSTKKISSNTNSKSRSKTKESTIRSRAKSLVSRPLNDHDVHPALPTHNLPKRSIDQKLSSFFSNFATGNLPHVPKRSTTMDTKNVESFQVVNHPSGPLFTPLTNKIKKKNPSPPLPLPISYPPPPQAKIFNWTDDLTTQELEAVKKEYGPKEVKRQQLIHELIETEKSFVKSLEYLICEIVQPVLINEAKNKTSQMSFKKDYFDGEIQQEEQGEVSKETKLEDLSEEMHCMRTSEEKKRIGKNSKRRGSRSLIELLKKSETDLIEIYKIHYRMKSEMENKSEIEVGRTKVVMDFSEGLLKYIDFFEVYETYLIRFENLIESIKKFTVYKSKKDSKVQEGVRTENEKDQGERYSEEEEEQEEAVLFLKSHCRSLGIGSMDLISSFLKPVQRLMKYPLFFKQLCDMTPIEHIDHQSINQLWKSIDQMIRTLEAKKNRYDEQLKIEEVESMIINREMIKLDLRGVEGRKMMVRMKGLKIVEIEELERMMMTKKRNGAGAGDPGAGGGLRKRGIRKSLISGYNSTIKKSIEEIERRPLESFLNRDKDERSNHRSENDSIKPQEPKLHSSYHGTKASTNSGSNGVGGGAGSGLMRMLPRRSSTTFLNTFSSQKVNTIDQDEQEKLTKSAGRRSIISAGASEGSSGGKVANKNVKHGQSGSISSTISSNSGNVRELARSLEIRSSNQVARRKQKEVEEQDLTRSEEQEGFKEDEESIEIVIFNDLVLIGKLLKLASKRRKRRRRILVLDETADLCDDEEIGGADGLEEEEVGLEEQEEEAEEKIQVTEVCEVIGFEDLGDRYHGYDRLIRLTIRSIPRKEESESGEKIVFLMDRTSGCRIKDSNRREREEEKMMMASSEPRRHHYEESNGGGGGGGNSQGDQRRNRNSNESSISESISSKKWKEFSECLKRHYEYVRVEKLKIRNSEETEEPQEREEEREDKVDEQDRGEDLGEIIEDLKVEENALKVKMNGSDQKSKGSKMINRKNHYRTHHIYGHQIPKSKDEEELVNDLLRDQIVRSGRNHHHDNDDNQEFEKNKKRSGWIKQDNNSNNNNNNNNNGEKGEEEVLGYLNRRRNRNHHDQRLLVEQIY